MTATVESSLLDYLPDNYRQEPHLKSFVRLVASYALADVITAGEAGQLMLHATGMLRFQTIPAHATDS